MLGYVSTSANDRRGLLSASGDVYIHINRTRKEKEVVLKAKLKAKAELRAKAKMKVKVLSSIFFSQRGARVPSSSSCTRHC